MFKLSFTLCRAGLAARGPTANEMKPRVMSDRPLSPDPQASAQAGAAWLADPAVVAAMLAPAPALLVGADGATLLLANAAAFRLLPGALPRGLAGTGLGREMERLSRSLPREGTPRLERLRLGASAMAPVSTCQARRLGGSGALLIVSLEPARGNLSEAERLAPLLAASGADLVLSPDGAVAAAGETGRALLARLGLDHFGPAAAGAASLPVPGGVLHLRDLGAGSLRLARFEAKVEAVTEAVTEKAAEPAPVAPQAADTRAEEVMPPEPQMQEPPAIEPVVTQPLTPEPVTPEPVMAAPVMAEPVMAEPVMAEALTPEPVLPEPVTTPEPRRLPLRFVWQTDAAGLGFDLGADLRALVGAPATVFDGQPLDAAISALTADPEGRIATALSRHDTFSSVRLDLPVEGHAARLRLDVSGMPVRGAGYRGFGLCRDLDLLRELDALRRATPAQSSPEPEPEPEPSSEVAPEPVAQAQPAPVEPEKPDSKPERPPLVVHTSPANVVALRTSAGHGDRRPNLSPLDRTTFEEIARQLGAKLEAGLDNRARPEPKAAPEPKAEAAKPEPATPEAAEPEPTRPAVVAPLFPDATSVRPSAFAVLPERTAPAATTTTLRGIPDLSLLDRVPVGVLVYRGDRLLYANRALLDWTQFYTLDAVRTAGGFERLFAPDTFEGLGDDKNGRVLSLRRADDTSLPVEARLYTTDFLGERALALILTRPQAPREAQVLALPSVELTRLETELGRAEDQVRELNAILDTATDGVLVVDPQGQVLSVNRSAEALFGFDRAEIENRPIFDVVAPESHRAVMDYLDGLTRTGVASLLNDGREIIGRVKGGGAIPLFMTMGRVGADASRLCAVLRDITSWKEAERDLLAAKGQAERASSAKSDFLAKISHEIRTPLNAIIGFSEVMMEERFGPVGNERYREYLRDIHTSGAHVISLVNDLLDLSKIEAGKLELSFTAVVLNDLVQQCVAIMQPQANRDHIIIRSSLATNLPPVVADARSIRQIVLNLLSNSIKFTPAGGQVIISTALTDAGEVVMRVRDTGVGMSEKDIQTALEPFRQLATSTRTPGTGLGLPLTKALAEANRALFTISSATNAGTLVEVRFPPNRVLAE
jgi:PAS domain S-box-containing protein